MRQRFSGLTMAVAIAVAAVISGFVGHAAVEIVTNSPELERHLSVVRRIIRNAQHIVRARTAL